MPAYFRYVTLVAYHAFLSLKVNKNTASFMILRD